MDKKSLPAAILSLLLMAGCGEVTPAATPTGAPVIEEQGEAALEIEEHAIVAVGEDTPDHMEYMNRISPAVLDVRRAWREKDDRLERLNAALVPFGYRLEGQSNLPLALYRGDTLIMDGLTIHWPASVSSEDFAFVAENQVGQVLLFRWGSVKALDYSFYAYTPPILVGNDLVTVEVGDEGRQFSVRRRYEIVYIHRVSEVSVAPPVKGLTAWNGQWVLEIDGQVIVDGQNLNEELGYDEIFGWRLLAGKPFYFFRVGDRTSISYDGEVLPVSYDEVIHYRCCGPARFNVVGNSNMVWFHARRDGTWTYVEIGVYE